jgi:hypothetical protein
MNTKYSLMILSFGSSKHCKDTDTFILFLSNASFNKSAIESLSFAFIEAWKTSGVKLL